MKSTIIGGLRWPLLFFSSVISFLFLQGILNLKILQLENTGAIFSVKRYHPLKKGVVFPVAEFPVYSVRLLERQKSILEDNIIITVITDNNVKKQLKIPVRCLHDDDFKKIKISIEPNP
ncbi:hypothetical protein JI747_011400 [Chryseobacterium sp. RG1]|uniref:Uncharacterized protein n=1 Tax=Chryseobacterium tagetis TaxID=2801334 RepID=A0ABS8A2X3_9FLAO|nr:hypothetical protein [Chryseobacterium tagetis]MCA6067787.1 hypothetical protein [Chryseobacterium tagetis]